MGDGPQGGDGEGCTGTTNSPPVTMAAPKHPQQAEDTLTALLKLVENRELRDAIDRAAGRVAYLREVAAFEAGYGFMPE